MQIILTEAEYNALKVQDPVLYARNQLRTKLRKVLLEYKDELELNPNLAALSLALSRVLEEEPTEKKQPNLPSFNP